ncbi:MAG: hypothetical protein PHR81_00930 [Bacteroidales bacterium]|jgi:tetratricopeptide (TPR) repeat protein|nr:hypothetical protein [Bacteroidales bacterium]MDD4213353.1 hypothetical protein [Bacteroidales bacterium]
MKKFIAVCICILTFLHPLLSQPDTKYQSLEYAKNGMKLFDQSKYKEAIEQYMKGKELDKDNTLFDYEIALSHFMLKDYQACIITIDSVIGNPNINEQFYQLLGNAYDMMQKPDTALQIYAEGMKRFPKAASLYTESGVVELNRNHTESAVNFWVKGTIINPTHAENYYQLARFYADSLNRIPALVYAEIFINLERNTAKTAEMGKLLCALLYKSIRIKQDSVIALNFYPDITIYGKNDSIKNVCDAVKDVLRKVSGMKIKNNRTLVGSSEIVKVRSKFLEVWFAEKYNERFKFSLFENQQLINKQGFFEAYTQWLINKCNVADFQKWASENSGTYASFAEWFKKHPYIFYGANDADLCR